MTGKNIYTGAACFALVFGLLLTGTGHAQEIRLQKAVVASGGSTVTNGTMTMSYTIGQPVVGQATNGTINGTFGFWNQIGQVSSVANPFEVGGVTLVSIAPNPVIDGEGAIALQIARAGDVDIALYNALGERVLTIFDDVAEPGSMELSFSTRDLAAGAYYVAVRVPSGLMQQSISVIK